MIPWWWLIVVWILTEIGTLGILALLQANGGPTLEEDAEQAAWLAAQRSGADW